MWDKFFLEKEHIAQNNSEGEIISSKLNFFFNLQIYLIQITDWETDELNNLRKIFWSPGSYISINNYSSCYYLSKAAFLPPPLSIFLKQKSVWSFRRAISLDSNIKYIFTVYSFSHGLGQYYWKCSLSLTTQFLLSTKLSWSVYKHGNSSDIKNKQNPPLNSHLPLANNLYTFPRRKNIS